MLIEKPSVLYDEEQVRARIAELGEAITADYAGREVCVVGLMKSCMVFMADLIRSIPLDTTCHFIRASALPGAGPRSACTDIVYSTEIPYAGRHILLLDDIIDTGITLHYLLNQIREARPAALKVCALVDKPGERKVDVHPDWTAFTLDEPEDRFLVGYGLDFGEHYRGLPFIGTIPRPAPPPPGAQES
jgi:hypoxanthine phosphoribosyltransferase